MDIIDYKQKQELLTEQEEEVLLSIKNSAQEFIAGCKEKYPFITQEEMDLVEVHIDGSLKLLFFRLSSSKDKEYNHKQKQLEYNALAFHEEVIMLTHLTLLKINNKRL